MSTVDEIIAAGIAAVVEEKDRLTQTARDLEVELQAAASEQRRIEQACGDELLDARFSGDTKVEKQVAKELEQVRIKRTMLEQQLAACRARIDDKELERWKTEAGVCRTEAAKIRAKAKEHWAHTEDLLRQINEYEQSDYILRTPDRQRGVPFPIGITARFNQEAAAIEERATRAFDMIKIFERDLARKRGLVTSSPNVGRVPPPPTPAPVAGEEDPEIPGVTIG